jgi:hypothetical protein
MKKILLIISVISIYTSILYAKVPNEINFQGYLRESGQPVTGNRTMCFDIFTQETGGIAV